MDQQEKNEESLETEKQNLDSLLDDALEDFSKPVIPQKNEGTVTDNGAQSTTEWTDEFISNATKNLESTMRAFMNQKESSTPDDEKMTAGGPVDLGAMSADFAKFAEAAAKAATEASSDQNFTHCLADALQQVAKNKEEAEIMPSADDLSKLMGSLGLGDNGTDLGGLFPLMQNMLENILSKEILYPPIKDVVTKYPDWLADNRSKLSEDDYDRYNKQYDIMKQVVENFEKEGESEAEKSQTSDSNLLLMQSLQELGQPPQELMGNYESLVTNDNGNPQLPDLSALLQGVGFPSFGAGESPLAGSLPTSSEQGNLLPPSNDENEECTLM